MTENLSDKDLKLLNSKKGIKQFLKEEIYYLNLWKKDGT